MQTFYVISTPIGNLGDITFRAVSVLKEVDIVLCEDTRVTQKLFQKYDIHTQIMSYHTHSKESKIDKIFEEINKGKNIALVTDAGTPGISDPGSLLISKIREKFPNLYIKSIPGPSAMISALSISGVDTSRFIFYGFLPHKKGRETLFKEISNSDKTAVFYESTHRIVKTLESLVKHLGGTSKKVTIAREMTKIFEEVISGTAEDLLGILSKNPKKQKGEFVVIVSE